MGLQAQMIRSDHFVAQFFRVLFDTLQVNMSSPPVVSTAQALLPKVEQSSTPYGQ